MCMDHETQLLKHQRVLEARRLRTQAARAYGAAAAAGLGGGSGGLGAGSFGTALLTRRLPESVIDRPPDRYRRLMDR